MSFNLFIINCEKILQQDLQILVRAFLVIGEKVIKIEFIEKLFEKKTN